MFLPFKGGDKWRLDIKFYRLDNRLITSYSGFYRNKRGEKMRDFLLFWRQYFFDRLRAVKPSETEQVERIESSVYRGTVQSVSGNEVLLSLKLPEFKKTPDIPISEIATAGCPESLFL